jgi:hypothetical protein
MPSSTTKATRRRGVVAAHLPTAHGKRVVFVSSNSDAASGVIAQLARDLGFAPIELGRIDEGGPHSGPERSRSTTPDRAINSSNWDGLDGPSRGNRTRRELRGLVQ